MNRHMHVFSIRFTKHRGLFGAVPTPCRASVQGWRNERAVRLPTARAKPGASPPPHPLTLTAYSLSPGLEPVLLPRPGLHSGGAPRSWGHGARGARYGAEWDRERGGPAQGIPGGHQQGEHGPGMGVGVGAKKLTHWTVSQIIGGVYGWGLPRIQESRRTNAPEAYALVHVHRLSS